MDHSVALHLTLYTLLLLGVLSSNFDIFYTRFYHQLFGSLQPRLRYFCSIQIVFWRTKLCSFVSMWVGQINTGISTYTDGLA